MSKIHCVVLLKTTKKTLIVDHKWIEINVNASEVDFGAKKSTERKIFYSPDSNLPNFDLAIKENFDEKVDACYIGYLLKSFRKFYGKYFFISFQHRNNPHCR